MLPPLVPVRPHHQSVLRALVRHIGETCGHLIPPCLGFLAVDQADLLAGVAIGDRCLRPLSVLELVEEAGLAVEDIFCPTQDIYLLRVVFDLIGIPQLIN